MQVVCRPLGIGRVPNCRITCLIESSQVGILGGLSFVAARCAWDSAMTALWSIYEVSDYLGCGSYGSRVVPEVECTS